MSEVLPLRACGYSDTGATQHTLDALRQQQRRQLYTVIPGLVVQNLNHVLVDVVERRRLLQTSLGFRR